MQNMRTTAENTKRTEPATQTRRRNVKKKWGECCQFGTIVKIEMLKRNLTSRELARTIGIAESTLCDILMGRNYSVETRRKIVEALGLPGSVVSVRDDKVDEGRDRIR